MIARFFIDRPIFAAVLSIVITLTGGIALFSLPVAQYPQISPPAVVVAISYPGASAAVVADTVAAPIEQQVNGVPGMLYMSSLMGNDGSYTLSVTFDIGTDLNTALVMVQNRVALALPQLPTSVQRQGITIRKKTPDILQIINIYSPDDRYDALYLSNFALINLYDEILRIDGVSTIGFLGEKDYSIRPWLDPHKLAARGITAGDVANAIRGQNLDAILGQVGQPPTSRRQSTQLPIDTLGRLTDPEQYGAIVVKVAQSGPAQPVGTPSGAPPGGTNMAVPAGGSVYRGLGRGTVLRGGSLGGGPLGHSLNTSTLGSGISGVNSTGMISSTSPVPGGLSGAPAPGTGMAGALSGISASGGSGSGSQVPINRTSMAMNFQLGGLPPSGHAVIGLSVAGGSPASNSPTGGGASGPVETPDGTMGRLSANPQPQAEAAALVRLRDVARVELGALNYNQAYTFNGRPAVGFAVYQLPDANALAIAERVQQKMKELKARFPAGVDYRIGYDFTQFIRESVADVERTLLEAVGLVALVVLVFLQNWRAALIPLIAVPVAIVGTFAVMAALGFTINNISLFGLVLAIGIVVDDAIVVVENVERWLEHGLPPREAARKAMDEVTGPVIAVALVLCAVFVPCAFISGITGQFFRQFALTIAVSTVLSAFNSLTLSPALAAILLRPRPPHPRPLPHEGGGENDLLPSPLVGEGPGVGGRDPLTRLLDFTLGWFFRGFNKLLGAGTSAYTWGVGKLLRFSALVLLVYGGLLLLTFWAFARAPTGFVPQQDMGRLLVTVQLPDSASQERTREVLALAEKIARQTPGVQYTMGPAGTSQALGVNSSNFGTLFIVLDPFAERTSPKRSANAIMAHLRKEYARQIQDGQLTVAGMPPIPGISLMGGFKLMVEDRSGLGLDNLQQQTDALIRKMQGSPGLVGVSTQFRSDTPQLYLDIDRAKVKSMGVSLDALNQTLQTYLGSLYVNSFNEYGRYWQVTLQAEGDYRARVQDIGLLQVRNNQGQMVPLSALVHAREVGGPVFVQRYNLYPAAAVTGNLKPGVSTGEAIAEIERMARATLSPTMATEWTELMFIQIRAGNTTLGVFALAVVFVFLALAALYESWAQPLAVILVVPLCLLCSVVGVLLAHRAVDIFVQIGLVVLVGLACKNAILIVEFAKQQRQEGKPRSEATLEATRLRLRPILMTSFAFILGVVPLVLATGAGSEMRRSLGTAVFSGMLGVTLFGIFLTPVFFYVIDWLGETGLIRRPAARWVGSGVLGALAGLAFGCLLVHVGIARAPWAPIGGAGLGLLGTLAALALRRRIRSSNSNDRASGAASARR